LRQQAQAQAQAQAQQAPNNNPYIQSYLQGNPTNYQQPPVPPAPTMQSFPKPSMSYTSQQSAPTPQLQPVPRQMTQFPAPARPPPTPQQKMQEMAYDKADQYSGINVLDAPVMKRTLEVEKVNKTDAKTLFNEVVNVSKTREEIDAELQRARENAKTSAPVTIKVEKKNIAELTHIDAKRQQEAAELEKQIAMKKTEGKPAMLATMTIQKKEPSKLDQEMATLMQRREMDMKNIQYR
jgi:hypothetical protein